MAKTAQRRPPVVSLITDHEEKSIYIYVGGTNGSLGLTVRQEGPMIAVTDPHRGSSMYKAVCELSANGHLKGWFVAHKGATSREDTLVFFPARKGRKQLPTARRVKE